MCGDSRLTFFGTKENERGKTNCSSVLFLCYLHKSLKRSPQCLSRTRPRKRKEDNIFAKFFFVIPSPLSCDVSVELVRRCSVYSYYLRSCCYPVFFLQATFDLWHQKVFSRELPLIVYFLFLYQFSQIPIDDVVKEPH